MSAGTQGYRRVTTLVWGTLLALVAGSGLASAAEPIGRSKGQTIYAAAYSYVLMGNGKHKFRVTSTLVIRNTDLTSPITLTHVDYRDSEGEHLRHYLEEPIVVGPLGSREFVVAGADTTGGHTPSFLLQWEADETVNAPVVETLMIGGASGRGVSFVGRAWVVEEAEDPSTQ